MHLVAADTSGIQSYIFGSNRLRENIGASYLVKQATGLWALQAVKDSANLPKTPEETNLKAQPKVEDGAAAEVIYSGGGNVVVLFREEPTAKRFMWLLSEKVMREAPGLTLLLALSDAFDWKTDVLTSVQQQVFEKLSLLKRNRSHNVTSMGLGVSLPCQSTGLPAVAYAGSKNSDQYPVSADVLAKHDAIDNANDELRDALKGGLGDAARYYAFPFDLDNLGRDAGENSFIAVVHADGNGIGKRVLKLAGQFATPDQNRAYVEQMREFSRRMNACSGRALEATLQKLVERLVRADLPSGRDRYEQIVHLNKHGDELATVTLKQVNHSDFPNVPQDYFLPFRPIVFGGDDLTFVCDGRLGISLTVEYLNQFEQSARDPKEGLLDWDEGAKQFVVRGATTAAGIAIVKTHYPFARAYNLAEDLCNSAKQLRAALDDQEKQKNSSGAWDGNTLDWHYALSGLLGSIGDIREREYTVQAGNLTVRPVALSESAQAPHRNWAVVEGGIKAFQSDWIQQRNKSKALRGALRGGHDATKTFAQKYLMNVEPKGQLPDIGVPDSLAAWRMEGWATTTNHKGQEENFCGYFDALELMDLYIPLHVVPADAQQTQSQEAMTDVQ
jgi:hypothetical protein